MSRSYKKHPIDKWSDSDDYGKRKANRNFRRKNRQRDYEDEEEIIHYKTREVIDNWNWGSEGVKTYNKNSNRRK